MSPSVGACCEPARISLRGCAQGALLGLLLLPHLGLAAGLADLYELAQRSDPTLRAAEAALEAAREAEAQARGRLFPDVTLAGNVTETRQEGQSFDSNGYSLTLTQPLYRRDRLAGRDQSAFGTRQAEARYLSAQQELIVRLASRYFDVLGAKDDLQFALAELKAIERQLEQTKQRFEVGLIAITDVHEAQARFDLTVAQEIVARNQLASAREGLREVTGEYHRELKGLAAGLPLLRPDPEDIEQWAESAREGNPGVVAAREAAEVARQNVEVQRSGHYPSVDVVADYSFSDVGGGFFGARELDETSLSLQLSLPLYRGGQTTAATNEARHLHRQALEDLERERRAVERETRGAYLNVLAAISEVRALEQALVSSRSALEATEAGFEVGTRTIVDVLDAQRDVFRAQRNLARSRYIYILNTLRLKAAAGTVTAGDVRAADGLMR